MNQVRKLGLNIAMAVFALPASVSAQTVTIAYPATPDAPGLRAIVQDAMRDLLKKEPELIANALRQAQANEASARQAKVAQAAVRTAAQAVGDPRVPAIGPDNGKAIVEFFDYNCPHCKSFAAQTFTKMQQERQDLRWSFIYAPILGPGSWRLAEFAAAAQLQGKFAAAHTFLIEREQPIATPEDADAIKDDLIKAAGLDRGRFDHSVQSGEARAIVEYHMKFASQAQLSGTPMIVVGNAYIPGFVPAELLLQHIQ